MAKTAKIKFKDVSIGQAGLLTFQLSDYATLIYTGSAVGFQDGSRTRVYPIADVVFAELDKDP